MDSSNSDIDSVINFLNDSSVKMALPLPPPKRPAILPQFFPYPRHLI